MGHAKRLRNVRGGLEMHDVLSPEECRCIMRQAEASGYHDGKGEVRFAGNRERAMFMQKEWADVLWDRIRHAVLPLHFDPRTHKYNSTVDFMPPAGDYVPIGVNALLRVSRYEPGGVFQWHVDSVYASGEDYVGFQTLLLYLNDGFEGGETVVDTSWFDHEAEEDIVSVTPRTGTVFAFDHSEVHQGSAVMTGCKYVVRTEIMFKFVPASASAGSCDSTADLPSDV